MKTPTTTTTIKAFAVPLLAAGLLTALTACGSATSTGHSDHGASRAATATAAAVGPVRLEDGWIKTAKKGKMTAVFGTLRNATGRAVTVTAAACPDAGTTQLHETVNDSSGSSSMREKKGGIEIAAGAEHRLAPGGDHIMLMKLTRDIKAGQQVELTVKSNAGDAKVTVLAKDYTGAKEQYDMGSSPLHSAGH